MHFVVLSTSTKMWWKLKCSNPPPAGEPYNPYNTPNFKNIFLFWSIVSRNHSSSDHCSAWLMQASDLRLFPLQHIRDCAMSLPISKATSDTHFFVVVTEQSILWNNRFLLIPVRKAARKKLAKKTHCEKLLKKEKRVSPCLQSGGHQSVRSPTQSLSNLQATLLNRANFTTTRYSTV